MQLENKTAALMAPVLADLRALAASVAARARTPHEAAFQRGPGRSLASAVSAFAASLSRGELTDAWAPLRRVQKEVSAFAKSAASLGLSDLSPRLAALRATRIPMPGLAAEAERAGEDSPSGMDGAPSSMEVPPSGMGSVTLDRLDERISVLASKTRPKRILLRGADGRRYAYLLKG